MKKIILLAACVFTISTATRAQETKEPVKANTERHKHEKLTPEQRAQKHVDKLNGDVTLTEAQKPKVYDQAMVMVKKNEEIKEKYKAQPENREAAKKEMSAVRKEYHKNINTILTPEQSSKLKEKRAAMKNKSDTKPAEQ